jgi:hypothetical protein
MPAVSVRFLAPGRLNTRQKRAQEIHMSKTTGQANVVNPIGLSLKLNDAISELGDRQRALCAIEGLIGFSSRANQIEPEVNRDDLAELVMAVNRHLAAQLEKVSSISQELHTALRAEA